MQTFETSTTVESHGEIRVAGLPFAPGTEVEVSISPKRRSAAEFTAAWQRVCAELRSRPGIEHIHDEDIQTEIDDYRAGR